ncbi:MAG: hypothetical protein ACRC6T_16405 [Sarcina sp.]
MNKKDLIFDAIEKALNLVRNLTEEELLALANNEKEFVLNVKAIIKNDERDSNNRKRTGFKKKGTQNERGSIAKKSKYESNQDEESNKKAKKGSIEPSFTKISDEPVNEFDLYIRELSRFRSKEEATNYLLDNRLTVTKLKILARKLSIYIKSKSKKIDIVEAIVEGIVGSMLKLEALREY